MKTPQTQSPKHPAFFTEKTVGVMVPLFSIRSHNNSGIGELLDLIPWLDWMKKHALSVLQLLPIYETAPDENSPYQAISSFAIDPVYLSITTTKRKPFDSSIHYILEDQATQQNIRQWRKVEPLQTAAIRRFKYRLLKIAFIRFKNEIWETQKAEALCFSDFVNQASDWLNDYALFWQLKEQHGWSDWRDWPTPYRDRESQALSDLKKDHADALLFTQYVQWILWQQWQEVRAHAAKQNQLIMGDMPFLVSHDSADIWCYRNQFHPSLSVGAPPDDFNAEGQNWGLPLFLWSAMERNDFSWFRLRIREASKMYDLIRLDHVVGFFRVWVMPQKGAPYFEPGDVWEQMSRGKKLLSVVLEEAGSMLPIAEDLGVIPDFVRHILWKMRVAGLKVLRWEAQNPLDYPEQSLATSGTHDAPPLRTWWQKTTEESRDQLKTWIQPQNSISNNGTFSASQQEATLRLLINAKSKLVILPIQDILGLNGQINQPGIVSPDNWSFRIPASLEALDSHPAYTERVAFLKHTIVSAGDD